MTSGTRNARSTTTEDAYLAERDTLATATSDKTGGRS